MSAVLEPPAASPEHDYGRKPDIDREQLRRLMQPSLFQWGIRTASDWAIAIIPMAVAGYAWNQGYWWCWPAFAVAVLCAGLAQHRLALMAHDGSHRQASRNKRLNDFLVGMFTLWPFANPVGGYRRFHFNHHRYLNTEGDPELHHKQKSSPAWDLPSGRQMIVRRFLEDISLQHVKELYHLSQNARPGTSKIDRLLPTGWWLCAFSVIAYSGQWWILPVWFLATAIVFWPIFRLRIWTEHVGTHDVHRVHVPWYLRFWLVPHNTWYHYEHHHFPQVPCWNLPKVRQLVGPIPEILPLYDVIRSYDSSPAIGSGAPTRKLGETLPQFDPRKVAEIPTEWEGGRKTGVGAGTGGEPVFHTAADLRAHAAT